MSEESSTPKPFISDRFANPEETMAAKLNQENFTWAAILGIIALVICLVLLTIMYLDMDKLMPA